VIQLQRDAGVVTVTIDRAEAMNALDVATLTELRDRLLELRDEPEARVVVLTGAGERAFVAGADIKYMSRLSVEEAKRWGGTQRLARVCGVGVAKDLILTGRTVDAEEALRLGLVSAVYEPGELLERVLETARRLASQSPLALAAAKSAINDALQGEHGENLLAEADIFGELFATDDAREGMSAFVEKRPPHFTGR
jgi:enoyl-CoA hydratase/carnithine racemase